MPNTATASGDNVVKQDVNLYLTVMIGHNQFVINTSCIAGIIEKPLINTVPFLPSGIAGVVNYRGNIIPVYDMRVLLGMPDFNTEKAGLTAALIQRKVDHQNWLKELESSVMENRKFTLQTDPHKCKFGVWYDNYRTDDFDLHNTLQLFDAPHKSIHKLAEETEGFISSGERDKAMNLINITGKSILSSMIKLFDRVTGLIHSIDKRLLVIAFVGDSKKALLIDAANDAVKIDPSCFKDNKTALDSPHKFVELKTGIAELLSPESLF